MARSDNIEFFARSDRFPEGRSPLLLTSAISRARGRVSAMFSHTILSITVKGMASTIPPPPPAQAPERQGDQHHQWPQIHGASCQPWFEKAAAATAPASGT